MSIIYIDILKNWAACWQGAVTVGILFMIAGRQRNAVSYLLLFADGVFLYYMLHVTLLSRNIGSRREIQLLPFMGEEIMSGDLHYLIENVLLFIPFGFLLCRTLCVFGRKWNLKIVLLISFLTSVSVEWLQYVFSCGKSETDDVMTNVLGAVIGYLIVKLKRV